MAMPRTYATAGAFRRALEERLKHLSSAEEIDIDLTVQRVVAAENSVNAAQIVRAMLQSAAHLNLDDWFEYTVGAPMQELAGAPYGGARYAVDVRMPELAVTILDYARYHGRVTSRDMVREAGTSPNTPKATFTSLVEKGLLERHGGGRSTWYSPS